MIDFPASSYFTAALADPRFYAVLGVTILSGVVRGFSGFGSALIYIPLVSAIFEPRIAAASFLLVDFFCTTPSAIGAFRLCNRREVFPLALATASTIPLGAMLLRVVDPILLRWFIVALILGQIAVLISGWRYRGKPKLPLTIGVGLLSGISGGSVQLTGPFAIIYWLSSTGKAAIVRANLLALFAFTGIVVGASYFMQELFTLEVITLSFLLALPYVLAFVAGARWFRGASELGYRRVAYAIITVAALVSLPIFDGFVR